MDRRHLQYFFVAAEEMSFRRAAERLKVSQPTITKRIATLEKNLGLDLFVRRENRIVSLTAAGKHYLGDARRLLDEIENATRSARAIAEGKGGRLRLGVCEDAATDRLARAVTDFHARLPDVDVDVLELPPVRLADGVRKSAIDLSLIVPPVDDHLLMLEPLWQDDWMVIVPELHELATKERISVLDLAGVGLILGDPQLVPGAHQQMVEAAFERAKIVPRVNVRAFRRSTMLFLVAAGAGVSFAPASFAGALPPGIVARPFDVEPLTVFAAYRANDPPGLAMQFLRVAKETAEPSANGSLSGA